MDKSKSILVVDDFDPMRKALKKALEGLGFDSVATAGTAARR